MLIEEDEGLQEEEPRRKEPAFLLYPSAAPDPPDGLRVAAATAQLGGVAMRLQREGLLRIDQPD